MGEGRQAISSGEKESRKGVPYARCSEIGEKRFRVQEIAVKWGEARTFGPMVLGGQWKRKSKRPAIYAGRRSTSDVESGTPSKTPINTSSAIELQGGGWEEEHLKKKAWGRNCLNHSRIEQSRGLLVAENS